MPLGGFSSAWTCDSASQPVHDGGDVVEEQFPGRGGAARIPALKADLGLTDAQLAIALVGLNAGAVAGLQLGSVVVTRLGSRRTLLAALPAFAGALLPIGFATSLAMLTVALAVSAGINSVVDIAINDQGVGIQHRYGRSLLTGMHAMHSLGGVLGGAMAAVAAYVASALSPTSRSWRPSVATSHWLSNRPLLPPEQLHGDHVRGSVDALVGRLDQAIADSRRVGVHVHPR